MAAMNTRVAQQGAMGEASQLIVFRPVRSMIQSALPRTSLGVMAEAQPVMHLAFVVEMGLLKSRGQVFPRRPVEPCRSFRILSVGMEVLVIRQCLDMAASLKMMWL